ncbi:hypothetical protein GCM10008955_01340 [Deinococcus malanensis]|uniref:Uncharacterized protein n=1 Tax=Deinococcus malanensis TaxID=1706855 RepID=A0ABQ2EHE5_9DEIO|nr:hypothetical protein [Deinococcus malanensis]GGK11837.1 hypothetical protein GCM10008955_01340 [Deinococcus malanensis]
MSQHEGFNVNMGLRGEVDWQLIDSATEQVVMEGHQDNLITNYGLDAIGTNGIVHGYNTSGNTGYLRSGFRIYACVGTGTTPPAITDTTLAAETGRSATAGPDTMTPTSPTPGEWRVPIQFEIPESVGNGNLREWGFSNGAGPGAVVIRGLFKDANGNDITVTKTDQQKLRLTHTLIVTASAAAKTVTAVVIPFTGDVTNRSGKYVMVRNTSVSIHGASSKSDLDGFSNMASGLYVTLGAITQAPAAGNLSFTMADGNAGIVNAWKRAFPSAYVSGSYERNFPELMFDTADLVGATIYGFAHGAQWSASDSYRAVIRTEFDAGQEFVKDNLHRIYVTGGKVTWGRA